MTMDSRDATAEELKTATAYVSQLGELSGLFTATIRAIRSAPAILKTTDPLRLKKFAVESSQMLIKVSPSLKTVFYHAASELYPGGVEMAMPITANKLLNIFTPNEIAAIIALTYVRKIIGKKCDAELWEGVLQRSLTHIAIAGEVGDELEGVGRGNGMLLGGLRSLAIGLFLRHEQKAFRGLLRQTVSKGKYFDTKTEREIYGCTHLQIAASLSSGLGYGLGPRLGFGLSDTSIDHETTSAATAHAQEEALHWRNCLIISEELHTYGEIRTESLKNHISDDLIERIETLRTGEGAKWLKEDASNIPEIIRELLNIPNATNEKGTPTT
jgi:hypothetical protein